MRVFDASTTVISFWLSAKSSPAAAVISIVSLETTAEIFALVGIEISVSVLINLLPVSNIIAEREASLTAGFDAISITPLVPTMRLTFLNSFEPTISTPNK